jgi:hypothetical protein
MVTIKEEKYLSLLEKTITYNVSQAIIDLENNKHRGDT